VHFVFICSLVIFPFRIVFVSYFCSAKANGLKLFVRL